jgi:ribosome biogenesis protein BRX1
MELMEIGPRFVLNPIRIFSGSFGGPTVYQNLQYISPNDARRMLKLQQAKKHISRVSASETAHERHSQLKGSLKDQLEHVFDEERSSNKTTTNKKQRQH